MGEGFLPKLILLESLKLIASVSSCVWAEVALAPRKLYGLAVADAVEVAGCAVAFAEPPCPCVPQWLPRLLVAWLFKFAPPLVRRAGFPCISELKVVTC